MSIAPTAKKPGIRMKIDYKIDQAISVEDFMDLLNRSTPGERRPVDNLMCFVPDWPSGKDY